MSFRKKLEEDKKTILDYADRLKRARKTYTQSFSAFTLSSRRSRALCAGELCLQAIEKVKELARGKPLMENSLQYSIVEQKVKDPDGRKGFLYALTYFVGSHEAANRPEEVRAKAEKLRAQLRKETEELYPREARKHADEMDSIYGAAMPPEDGAAGQLPGTEEAEKSVEEQRVEPDGSGMELAGVK